MKTESVKVDKPKVVTAPKKEERKEAKAEAKTPELEDKSAVRKSELNMNEEDRKKAEKTQQASLSLYGHISKWRPLLYAGAAVLIYSTCLVPGDRHPTSLNLITLFRKWLNKKQEARERSTP